MNKLWVARDDFESFLCLYSGDKPTRDKERGIWACSGEVIELPTDHPDYMDITWDNNPVEVILSRVEKECPVKQEQKTASALHGMWKNERI